ncbi:MAG: hypothetical protein FJ221_05740 [Lentisphaerae bacterium]|nr:hypothetical protein [Lentisphaerota bacterium]
MFDVRRSILDVPWRGELPRARTLRPCHLLRPRIARPSITRLVVGCWLLDVGCWMLSPAFDVRCWLFGVRRSIPGVPWRGEGRGAGINIRYPTTNIQRRKSRKATTKRPTLDTCHSTKSSLAPRPSPLSRASYREPARCATMPSPRSRSSPTHPSPRLDVGDWVLAVGC